jgi:type 2 lantibiotic biosynthesis protein LanM
MPATDGKDMTVLMEPHGLLGADAPYEIASRASNLAEQIRIVEALPPRHRVATSDGELTGVDVWRLQRLARKLAHRSAERSHRGRGGPGTSPCPEELERILRINRLLQLRSGRLSPAERRVLEEVHAAWLPTYSAALGGFDPLVPRTAGAGRSDEPGGRRRLALACAPFLRYLRCELEAAAGAANRRAGRELVLPAIVDAFEEHLIDRFELSLAWAVEVDRNVARARRGVEGHRPDDDGEGYYEARFRDAASYHRFYVRFPVLGRWLAAITRELRDNGQSLIGALCRDVEAIGRQIFGEPVVRFTSLELGKSDYHAGGRSVGVVGVALASGPDAFVYKPRSLDAEVAVQRLLERLTAHDVIGFAPHRVIARDGYGYEQRIPSDRNHVRSREEAARVYEEIGGFLGIFHVLGGSDLHYENVMVANGRAFVCDCETVLRVAPPGQEPAAGTVLDSVYRTGLLEWPLPPTADIVLRLSGCEGGQSYEIPFALPRLQEGPEVAVRHETGIRVEQDAPNRIYLDGSVLEPKDFRDAILRGFSRVHEWFQHHPALATPWIRELFADTRVRFVARSTQIYAQLLIGARHPQCLMQPLEVDLVFRRLNEAPHPWDRSGLASAGEAGSLWQLDVPIFSVPAAGTDLLHDHATPVAVEIERSPLQVAADRIRSLSADDRLRQVEYVSASLSLAEVHSASFGATALEYARLVGEALHHRLLEEPMERPGWFSRAPDADVEPVEGSLYYGSAGIALFLAYLDSIDPDERLRWAAERAVAHTLGCAPGGIGAFQGLAGLAYLLAHLHRLWGGSRWLDLAVGASRQLDGMIEQDRAFDVLSGSAGVIPVMLGLAGVSGEGLDTAHRCARHLLEHAEGAEPGLSWPPERRAEAVANFTGFAHGAAGIGWALIALGASTSREDYLEAGRRAFAYEASHFDQQQQDWHDLRSSVLDMAGGRPHFGNAWCNGAAGIGLSRLASWAALGKNDDDLLKEAYLALSATLRNFMSLGNDTLCHGRSGNAELFLQFARLKGEPAFQLEANVQAQAQWRQLAVTPGWPEADGSHRTMPGLMVGIAGIGMHFLRLAHPDRVPSPLLLDPPPGG